MSRYLTHIKRLREPAEPVARFLGRAEALGDKLGPVLLQLPAARQSPTRPPWPRGPGAAVARSPARRRLETC